MLAQLPGANHTVYIGHNSHTVGQCLQGWCRSAKGCAEEQRLSFCTNGVQESERLKQISCKNFSPIL